MKRYKLSKLNFIFLCLLVFQSTVAIASDLRDLYKSKSGTYQVRTHHKLDNGEPKYVNQLIKQTSPYLLQHAHNPVNWLHWSDDAFSLARKLDKPVFISIGYSTCHWCHVMERESFESETIANLINENFVAVKVDREEHPDVDEVYLNAVQMLSGKVGWPLTVVVTPEAEPFFGGTYIAPDQLTSLLKKINTTWKNNRPAVLEQAKRTTLALERLSQQQGAVNAITRKVISESKDTIATNLYAKPNNNEPGFPREPEMLFILDQIYRDLDQNSIAKLSARLDAIMDGGIHDHVGGGFHRYTVNSDWVIPHFEKMLYNQAQLGEVFIKAYQLTGDIRYKETAEATFNFALQSMNAENGGFYSATDAESDKGEGLYYTWSYDELEQIFNADELRALSATFTLSETGNFQGRNVFSRKSGDTTPASDIPPLLIRLEKERLSRTAPSIDTKVITAWNALMASSLLAGHKATNNQVWRDSAINTVATLWEKSWHRKKGLARTIPSNKYRVEGSLEDYAFMGRALLDAYDATDDAKWLERAETLTDKMIELFHDDDKGAFVISGESNQSTLIVPLITARDDSITSGNSVAAQLLAKLYARTGKTRYRSYARRVIGKFSKQIIQNPQSLSGMLLAASILNDGENGPVQYAAKGNVQAKASVSDDELAVEIDIKPGWHINASEVLQDYLIPSLLSSVPASCTGIENPSYPEGKLVSLGFQKDQLMIYEGSIKFSAKLTTLNSADCKLLSTTLRLQACTDEVCAAPETLKLNTRLD